MKLEQPVFSFITIRGHSDWWLGIKMSEIETDAVNQYKNIWCKVLRRGVGEKPKNPTKHIKNVMDAFTFTKTSIAESMSSVVLILFADAIKCDFYDTMDEMIADHITQFV